MIIAETGGKKVAGQATFLFGDGTQQRHIQVKEDFVDLMNIAVAVQDEVFHGNIKFAAVREGETGPDSPRAIAKAKTVGLLGL